MLKKSIWITVLIMLVLLITLTGCTGTSEPDETVEPEEATNIKISFEPNPVPCDWYQPPDAPEGKYLAWKVTLTETEGIGVKLTGYTREIHGRRGLPTIIRNYDSSAIEKAYDSAYLPPYGSLFCDYGRPCQPVDYEIFTFTGINDNGEKVKVTGRLDFLQP